MVAFIQRHALERMAPNTPQVRAELEGRAVADGLAQTNKFYSSIQPRGITPTVIEHVIQSATPTLGKEPVRGIIFLIIFW